MSDDVSTIIHTSLDRARTIVDREGFFTPFFLGTKSGSEEIIVDHQGPEEFNEFLTKNMEKVMVLGLTCFSIVQETVVEVENVEMPAIHAHIEEVNNKAVHITQLFGKVDGRYQFAEMEAEESGLLLK